MVYKRQFICRHKFPFCGFVVGFKLEDSAHISAVDRLYRSEGIPTVERFICPMVGLDETDEPQVFKLDAGLFECLSGQAIASRLISVEMPAGYRRTATGYVADKHLALKEAEAVRAGNG